MNVGREWIVHNPFVGIIVRGPNEVGCSHPLGRLTHHARPFLSAQPDVPNEAAQLLFSSSWAQTVRARTLASTAGRPMSAVRRMKARRSSTRVAVADAAAPGEGRSGLGRRLSATLRPECLPGDALTTPQTCRKASANNQLQDASHRKRATEDTPTTTRRWIACKGDAIVLTSRAMTRAVLTASLPHNVGVTSIPMSSRLPGTQHSENGPRTACK